MAALEWWKMPLPPNWESKFDPGQGRYFFINHATRATQWHDPRKDFYAHMAQSRPAGEHIQMQNMASHRPQETQLQETTFIHADETKVSEISEEYPTAPKDVIRTALQRHHNNKTAAISDLVRAGHQKKVRVNEGHVATLNREFPSAPAQIVRDVLTGNNNDLYRSRNQLKNMGFGAMESESTTHRSPTPPREPSPPPKKSHAEIQRIKNKLYAEFKDQPTYVVDIALETYDNDEDKVRRLLNRRKENEKKTASPARAPSPVQVPSSVASSSSSMSTSASARSSASPTRVADTAPVTTAATKKATKQPLKPPAAKKKQEAKKPPAKKVEARPSPPKQTTRRHQVTQPAFVSELRTQPKGPDSSLRKGPDKGHLLDEYITVSGFNSDNAKGHNPDNFKGTTMPAFSDPSLRNGPQKEHRAGPNTELVHGSIYVRKRIERHL